MEYMEYLDIVDENGEPTGKTVERARAHAEGIPHRTSHVWLLRKKAGRVEVLLQKRCDTKDSFPGCYDISSAGHIPAGVGFIPSAIRELKEELGINAAEDELMYCGDRIIAWDDVFHGKPFHDRQFARVFALWCDRDEAGFTVQKEEISSVLWMELDTAITAVEEKRIPSCIFPEELRTVQRAISSKEDRKAE